MITYLRKGKKKAHCAAPERGGVGKYRRRNYTDARASEEGEEEIDAGTRVDSPAAHNEDQDNVDCSSAACGGSQAGAGGCAL